MPSRSEETFIFLLGNLKYCEIPSTNEVKERSRGETLFHNNQNVKTPASVICCNSWLCVSKSVNIVISACFREKDQIYR